jgi:hypothetical protein
MQKVIFFQHCHGASAVDLLLSKRNAGKIQSVYD